MSVPFFTHACGVSTLCIPRESFSDLKLIQLEYKDEIQNVPCSQLDAHFFYFPIDHAFLSRVGSLSEFRILVKKYGINLSLKELEGCSHLLDCFDVDSHALFWSKVATTARPVQDHNLLRLLCKRAVLIYEDDYNVQGASICALGYRILDSDLNCDPDLLWFLEYSNQLLGWRETVSPYDDARWGTSILMLLGYYYINVANFQEAMRWLSQLLYYRSAIKTAPLIQTNLVRASLLLADYYMAIGDYDRAVGYLEEVPRIAKDGVWWSDLVSDPILGMYKYTEFDVILCGAKEATKVLSRYDLIREKKQSKIIRLQDLGGYVGVLSRRGKLNYAG